MHASTTDSTRPFQSAFDASRSKKGRRTRSRSRYFVSTVVSAAIAFVRGLLWALQDSRSREATRVIDRYRHLRQDFRPVSNPDLPKDAGTDARQTNIAED
jgi:hypothetical protein